MDCIGTAKRGENSEFEELNKIDRILFEVYPNPFSNSTNIMFSIPETGKVTLNVFDLAGTQVATLFDGVAEENSYYSITFDGNLLPAGIFVCTLKTEESTNYNKLVMIK